MRIQSLKAHFRFLLLSLTCLCAALQASTQTNGKTQKFFLTPGEMFSTTIYSAEMPNTLVAGLNGDFDPKILSTGTGIENPSLGKNQWKIEFLVSEDFEGVTSLDVEYFEEVGIRSFARYTKLIFDVSESQVITKHDYKTIGVNSENEIIDVLDNDFTTHGPLEIKVVAHQENGTAAIVDGNLVFSPQQDFMGMAYVNYVATHAKGRTAMGTASICVLDPSLVGQAGTIDLVTSYDKPVPVLLPSESFDLTSLSLEHGKIEQLGTDVFEYIPSKNQDAVESFTISDTSNGLTRTINIRIVGDDRTHLSVVDDEFFTEVNTEISFDAFANDNRRDNAIVSYSDELTHLGGGSFSYTPPNNYQGIKRFQYETFDGFEYNLGNITIYINNYYPADKTKYEFVTKENTAFIINYEAPIEAYGFKIVGQPNNGNLYSLDAYNYACGRDEGSSLIVYEPKAGFLGIDNFDLEYCVNGANCKPVNIEVEVIAKDDECNCAGRNCVWAGDANRDGKVSIGDLLTLGYHIGDIGNARNLNSGNRYSAEFADDWNNSQVTNGLDVKHIDANGDGIITAEDVDAIDQNFDRYNNVVAQEFLELRDYPIQIIPSETSVDSGDWLSLDIILGSEENPVVDVHGIAYNLRLAPGFVVESSVEVIDHSRIWLGNNSPILSLWKQPTDGNIHLGSTRTTGETVSGIGQTHTVGFIVEEELEGLRRNRSNPITILVENISFVDGSGQKYRLPNTSIDIDLNASEDNEIEALPQDLHIIPNPATDYIRLHLNGKESIKAVQLFDIRGQLIHSVSGIDTDDYSISTEGMIDGVYVAKVITDSTSISKKVKVVNQ